MHIGKIRERTLAKDLVVSLTLAVVVFVILFIGVFLIWSSSNVDKEMNQQADEISTELVEVLVLPAYQYDTELIKQIIHVYQQKKIVSRVQVTLISSDIVIESWAEETPSTCFRRKEIIYNGTPVAVLELYFYDQFLRQQRALVVKMMLFVSVIIILIIVAGSFRFVHDNVQVPLEKLLVGITRIADGQYETVEVTVPQKDLSTILNQVQQMGIQIHQKNEMIQAADARYRSIFDAVTEGLFQATTDGRFLTVNQAMVRILGFKSAQDMIDSVTDIGVDIFVDASDFYTILECPEGQVTCAEYQVYHRAGHKIWVSLNVKVRCGSQVGRVLEGSLEDITELRELEANLRQSQKMEAVGTMAGGIAHDFNNILTAIMGYTELAQMRGSSPELMGDLQEIHGATERAKDLTSQILTFSRRDEVVVEAIPVAPVIEEALRLITASLPENIDLQHEIKCAGQVKIAGTKLHQVVMNLCTNAHHAMTGSGGILGVSLRKVNAGGDTLLLGVDLDDGEYLLLEVSDTGCGMGETTKEKIFEPYYSTKKVGQGTGLGLAVVHAIVESAGGRISAYSLPARGTSFHVYLPIG